MFYINAALNNIGHNESQPNDPDLAFLWNAMGAYYPTVSNVLYTPIGRNLVCQASHRGDSVPLGMPIEIQGMTVKVTEVINTEPVMDIRYYRIDRDLLVWFPRLKKKEDMGLGSSVLTIGSGIGTSGFKYDKEYWPYFERGGPETARKRWGINTVEVYDPDIVDVHPEIPIDPAYPRAVTGGGFGSLAHRTNPESIVATTGDSGCPCFVQVGGKWVLAGLISGSGGQYLHPYKLERQWAYWAGSIVNANAQIAKLNGEDTTPEPEVLLTITTKLDPRQVRIVAG